MMNNRLVHRLAALPLTLSLAISLVSLPVQSAQAQSFCAQVDNDIARLQCYDERELSRTSATVAVPVVPAATPLPVVVAPTNPASVQEPETLAEVPIQPAPSATVVERTNYREAPTAETQPEEIHSTITAVTTALNGRKVFLLENGQRWQETREYGLRFRIGSDVYLKKGYVNGYNMTSGRNTVRVLKL